MCVWGGRWHTNVCIRPRRYTAPVFEVQPVGGRYRSSDSAPDAQIAQATLRMWSAGNLTACRRSMAVSATHYQAALLFGDLSGGGEFICLQPHTQSASEAVQQGASGDCVTANQLTATGQIFLTRWQHARRPHGTPIIRCARQLST